MKTQSISKQVALSCALMVMASVVPAYATNLVTNGSFTTTAPVSSSFSIDDPGNPSGANNSGGADYLAGWTTTPINGNNNLACLVFNTSAAGTPISSNTNLCGTVAYAPNGISFPTQSNGTTPLVTASPDGGNFIAIDSAVNSSGQPIYAGPLQQVVSNLTVGMTYALSFYQAATQQLGHSGATTDTWDVTLGNQTIDGATMSIATQGFSGWQQQTLIFTATSTQETLSFLAMGTPANADPPFALLDGVNLSATPEPGTFGLIGLALLSVPAIRSFRKKR